MIGVYEEDNIIYGMKNVSLFFPGNKNFLV